MSERLDNSKDTLGMEPGAHCSAEPARGSLAELPRTDAPASLPAFPARRWIPAWQLIERLELKRENPDISVLLIEDGESFIALDSDADICGRELGLSICYVECETRTLAQVTIPECLASAALGKLREAGFTAALAADPNGAIGPNRRPVIFKRAGTKGPRHNPRDRVAEAIKTLPTPLRKVAEEFLDLKHPSDRCASRAICRWLRVARMYPVIVGDGGRLPAVYGREACLPDPEKLAAIAEVMACFEPDDQSRVVKCIKRFHDLHPDHVDEELEGWSSGDDSIDLDGPQDDPEADDE